MNGKYNLYTRTEEEKSRDLIMYETKAKAAEIYEKYETIHKKANLFAFIGCIVLIASGIPLFYLSYDRESFAGMAAVFFGVIILTALVRLSVGAVLSRSIPVFIKWGTLCAKWKSARADMHEYEARFAEQTVFEADIKKAEEKLMCACDELIAFANKHNISID